jgi:hypothetical protein
MKKLGLLMLMLAIAVMLGGTALATSVAPANYFVTYYSNANTANAPDATVRVINDGDSGQNLWADFYVFDDSEELTECCSCIVTPDGLLSESVNKNLTANPITGIKPTRGVIKLISSFFPGASTAADANAGTGVAPFPGLRGSATHVQKSASGFALSETELAGSNLSGASSPASPTGELLLLEQLCYFDKQLSGQPCTCTPEDQDF